jgi:hypothetical protein
MKTYVITSKLNFRNSGGSVEQIDFVMRQLMAQGNDVVAVTVTSSGSFAGSGPSSPRSCGWKGCSVTLTIAAKLRPTQAWRRALGRAGEQTVSRASRKPGTEGAPCND